MLAPAQPTNPSPTASPPHDRIVYSPAEAADVLGVTRQTVYALIKRGQLRRFKVGRSTRIPTNDVHALVGYEPGDAA
jgi:excisionase family DNA binding protein